MGKPTHKLGTLKELSPRDKDSVLVGEHLAATPSPPPAPPKGPLPAPLTELHDQLRRKGQVILQGPPGVGKTYRAREFIDWLAGGRTDETRLSQLILALDAAAAPADIAQHIVDQKLPVIWDIVQFHPSYTYEDFIRGLVAKPTRGGVTFEAANKTGGLMLAVAGELLKHNSSIDAVLVIDEINRGDISKIFGELIYGLEYRGEPVTSPYAIGGDASVSIPKNLLLIGTMNTADRSIALVDYALRRRFVFLDERPDEAVLDNAEGFSGDKDRDAAKWLFRLAASLFTPDAIDLQVGHSYFIPKNASSETEGYDQLATRFGYEVYPLLREYVAEGRIEESALASLLADVGAPAQPRSQAEVAAAVRDKLATEPWTAPPGSSEVDAAEKEGAGPG